MRHWRAEQSSEQAGNGSHIPQKVCHRDEGQSHAKPSPKIQVYIQVRSERREEKLVFHYQSWKLCFFRSSPGWLAAKTAQLAQSHPLSFREALTSSFHHFTFNRKNLKGNIISCMFCCSSLTTLLHWPRNNESLT